MAFVIHSQTIDQMFLAIVDKNTVFELVVINSKAYIPRVFQKWDVWKPYAENTINVYSIVYIYI